MQLRVAVPWKILNANLGAKQQVVVAQTDERHANRMASVLEWYDRRRTCNIWFKRRNHIEILRFFATYYVGSYQPASLFLQI